MTTMEEQEHSPVGPSSISSIILCPGKVRMCKGIEDKTSIYAAEGTVAHLLCERRLLGHKDLKQKDIIRHDGFDIPITPEMIEAVDLYDTEIEKISAVGDNAFYKIEKIEGKVSLKDNGLPEIWGTVDYSLAIPNQTLYIRDFKYGQGITVEAEQNEQMMCYAIGAAGQLLKDFDTINIGIIQPRAKDGNAVKTWETTPAELIDWMEQTLKPAVTLALGPDAPLVPGESQCRWCAGKSKCPAIAEHSLMVARSEFEDFSPREPKNLTMEELIYVYSKIKTINGWLKAIEGRVFETLNAGQKVKGFKLVRGKSNRVWADPKKAGAYLSRKLKTANAYTKKVISPAQAEKLVPDKKRLQKFITKPEGKLTIAPENDKRPAILTAVEDFTPIEETQTT